MLTTSNPLKLLFFSPTTQRLRLTIQSKAISSTPAPSSEHIASLILDQKSATQVLQTFRWASKLSNFSHTQFTYRALIHKLCTFRRFDTVWVMLDEMPSSIGSPPDDDVFVTVVRGLGKARMIREVVKVLDTVCKYGKEPSLKLYNSILDVLVKVDIDIARKFYRNKMMECGVRGDEYTYGILMKGLCLTNRIRDAFKLLQVMKTRGVMPNVVIYNTLMHALCKNGKIGIGRARSLMSEMKAPNDVTFNILISAYCGEGKLVQSLVMLEKSFDNGFVPDVVTVTKVVEVLCNAGRATEAMEVFERAQCRGGRVDVVSYNTLIRGFCAMGKVKVGQRFLKEMELKGCLPNVDTYNELIEGFCKSEMLDLAFDMFNEMKIVGISWNFVTYDTLIYGLCAGGRLEDGFKILELMEEAKGGSQGRISPYNSVLYGFYKENRLDEALDFLYKLEKLFPRAVDRSLKIIGFCKEDGVEDARRVYDQMTHEGDIPSVLIYVSLIQGYCQEGNVREAFEMTNEMIAHEYFPTASTTNALISEFCRQDKIESAAKLLKDMIGRGFIPDCGSYSALVAAFCRKQKFHKVLHFFLQMVEQGIIPDVFSWNALVMCLSQETLWVEATKVPHLNYLLQSIIEA